MFTLSKSYTRGLSCHYFHQGPYFGDTTGQHLNIFPINLICQATARWLNLLGCTFAYFTEYTGNLW